MQYMVEKLARRDVLALMGSLVLGGCVSGANSETASSSTWIPDAATETRLREVMKTYQVPGVGIAIIEDGTLVWEGAYGLTNIATAQPVTQTTLFQAASLTKPVFAYAVLRLVDAGQITLDERLVETVRPEGLSVTPWNEMISVRHVLTHRTGLLNWRSSEDANAKLEAGFEPGTAYSYSGEAFHWLQQVCEQKTGLGLQTLMNHYVFTPADLTDMAMLWLPERDAREVYGHVVNDAEMAELSSLQWAREHGRLLQEVAESWGKPMTLWSSEDQRAAHAQMRPYAHPKLKSRPLWRKNRPGSAFIDSASSLRTTAGDYARFLTLLMKPVDIHNGGLSESLRRQMIEIQTTPSTSSGPNRPAGMSWSLEPMAGGIAYDHWGFNEGQYISMALGDTVRQKGVVIMTNGARGNRFMDAIGPEITGVPYQSFF